MGTSVTKNLEILIAEDDPGNFALTKKLLRSWGLTGSITYFADGQTVLDFFFDPDRKDRHEAPNYLLLLDINLSGVNGRQVMQKLKADTRFHRIPVMIMADTEEASTVKECRDLGCCGYFVKPLKRGEFYLALTKAGIPLPVVGRP